MELDKPNPANQLMIFKKELWLTDYSTRMQRWLSGEKLPPVRIDAELHRRCNLECVHCIRRASKTDMTEESKKIEVDSKRWLEIAEESGKMGVRAWNIAGIGEPMCKPNLLMPVMKTLKKHKIFGEITTNGTLWNHKDLVNLVKIGWDSINVSIDAPVAKIHDKIRGVPGTFDKAVSMVRSLSSIRKKHRRTRPAIAINLVLNRLNYQHLPQMIDFVSEIGADALFVEPMIVHSEQGEKIRLRGKEVGKLKKLINTTEKKAYEKNIMTFITCLEGDDEKKEFNKDLVEKTSDMKDVIQKKKTERHENDENKVGEPLNDIERILSTPCYYPWFYLIVNADGSVIHCGECNDLRENIKNKSLKEIWYGDHFTELRDKFLGSNLPDYCNKCRPNVIGDMNIVRKSIKEYADIPHLQKKVLQLFKDNIHLKEQVYYAREGTEPPAEKKSIFERINVFRF